MRMRDASLERYDSRVKAMELDEKPKDEYTDIGGLDKQIEVWWRLSCCLWEPL